jgi:transposase
VEAAPVGAGKKNARRLNAHLAFLDESGFLLIPNVKRTWALRGETPIVRHRYRRDKISAISALTVSPQRRRFGFYIHLHTTNITGVEVTVFLRSLLRHVRGHVVAVLDNGRIHKGVEMAELLRRQPRLHIEWFPGYAPELNPDEFVWTHCKNALANSRPDNVDELLDRLCHVAREIRRRPHLIRSFVLASDLPAFL